MGVCKPEVEERAITSAAIYLSVAVLCPIAAFTLVWKRRWYFPIYPAPRNWVVYAVVLGLGPLVLSPNFTWPFLLVVLGDSSQVCNIRFYTYFVGGFGALLAMLLSFIQVLARYEFADLQCELLFVEEAAESSEMAKQKAEEFHSRLRVVLPRTRNRFVFYAWICLTLLYSVLLVIIDLNGPENGCGGSVIPGHCYDSCVICESARLTHVVNIFSIQGCAIVLLCRSRKLSDEFGILLELQAALSFFLPCTLLNTAISGAFPRQVWMAWPEAVGASVYSSILPCAVFCGWPVARTFQAGNYSLIRRPSSKKAKASAGEVSSQSSIQASRGEASVKSIHSKASSRGETLDGVLASSVGKHALVEFLIREFSVESILFWHRVTALKEKRRRQQQQQESTTRGSVEGKKYTRNERRLRLNESLTAVRDVHRSFVEEGAVHEVNLPHTLRVRLADAITAVETAAREAMPSRFDTDTDLNDARLIEALWSSLDAALAEIVNVLENDTFPRFIKSPQYGRYRSANAADGQFEYHNKLHGASSSRDMV
jgi:hypothetical protein